MQQYHPYSTHERECNKYVDLQSSAQFPFLFWARSVWTAILGSLGPRFGGARPSARDRIRVYTIRHAAAHALAFKLRFN